MKKIKQYSSLALALAIPLLAACGSTAASAESPNPEQAVVAISDGSTVTAEPRWSPPAETAAQDAAEAVQTQPAAAQNADSQSADSTADEQAFPPVGVSDSEVLAVLGKPSRSELGQNSRHLYYSYDYRGITFSTVEVDRMSDGTVWLINFETDSSVSLETVQAFTEDWVDAVSAVYGTPGVSHADGPVLSRTSYSWRDYTLTLDEYTDGKFVVGFFYQNAEFWENH